ncbi:MAG: DoxX family protein [Bacteroidetes bacterium]|nr:DoxX family protein [Bacteroidota bacterium]
MKNENLGKLILRLTVGGLMLFHGIAKLQHGVGGIENGLQNVGVPGFIAYGVYIGEILAPLLIIFGFRTRAAALVVAFTMVVATALVHMNDIFSITNHGAWGIELQAFYFLSAMAIFLLGAGSLSFSNSNRWD